MLFIFLLFVTRKPCITPAEFKSHYTKHVELVQSIAGEAFPLTHTRHYIDRTNNNGSWDATVLIGTQEDFTYDGIAELVFPSKTAFETFYSIISAPEAAAKIAADEETFILRDKMRVVVIGDKTITTKE
ncbi:hypothetical protein BS50DRAFT_343546 [Corynespora cassiicola Philippines]|uniref:EthD domain-containing protein n=1 Tax=Corynespora cassiicola Philippines TaxID=1448308 RepID=A0A2T2NW71_CORCC|nr:hypothetical protein BS50DRAFT_343546 [Corynespora cassiicola Philippines]